MYVLDWQFVTINKPEQFVSTCNEGFLHFCRVIAIIYCMGMILYD